MKTHIHKWKIVGYANVGWGITTDCPVLWCSYCGSLCKQILGYKRTIKPQKYSRKK